MQRKSIATNKRGSLLRTLFAGDGETLSLPTKSATFLYIRSYLIESASTGIVTHLVMDLGLAIITGGRVPRSAVYITRTQVKFALSLDETAVNSNPMQTGILTGFFFYFFFLSFNGYSNEGERTRVFNAYSEGKGENVLYVQNGQQVKCQRRHVTPFVDKLVGTLVLFVPCCSAENSVSFSRCNVSDASAVALDYFYIRVANFGHILHAPSFPPCEILAGIDDDRACFYDSLAQ